MRYLEIDQQVLAIKIVSQEARAFNPLTREAELQASSELLPQEKELTNHK